MGTVIVIPDADFSAVAVARIEKVGIPQISINTLTKNVTLSAFEGIDIHYTTNGDTPTPTSTLYTAPFTVNDVATIKAIATDGVTTSEIPQILVTVKAGGRNESVELTASGTIRYTTDGSTPSASSTQYSEAIPISGNMTIKAAVFSGNDISEIATITLAS